MIKWIVLLMGAAMFVSAQDQKPRQLTGAALETGAQVSNSMGTHGAWLIESAVRWEAVLKTLTAAGVKVEDNLGAVDFAKENLLCVFHVGDVGDQFSVRRIGGDGAGREVEIAMSYIIYKSHAATPPAWKVLAVPVGKAPATKVSVLTFHPMNGGAYPTKDKAHLEWEWTFSEKTGEAIGGLIGTIEPKAATVKPGEDILLKFTLSLGDAAKVKTGPFARVDDAMVVWDGKYSAGYRNHGFEVIAPDGTVHLLRPAVIDQWDKNAPHPVTIKAGQPYVLPNWGEEIGMKSLKQLGLDTSKPGVYRVTGTYSESGGPSKRAGQAEMWGGQLRTNTVRVEVK